MIAAPVSALPLPAEPTSAAAVAAAAAEKQAREELAAVYRLVAHFGMADLIFTHISLRLPGPDHHFLINPYGLLFDEITASSLVKIDLDGRPVEPTSHLVNPAGFVIHSAIHRARPDALCVLHTHSQAGCAVAAQAEGLLPLNQISMEFAGRVGYHDYEGVALSLAEQDRLVADLKSHNSMILRNHGLLTVGDTAGRAYLRMHYLDKACRIQVDAQRGGSLVLPPAGVVQHAARQLNGEPVEGDDYTDDAALDLAWSALRRLADRIAPDHRD